MLQPGGATIVVISVEGSIHEGHVIWLGCMVSKEHVESDGIMLSKIHNDICHESTIYLYSEQLNDADGLCIHTNWYINDGHVINA